LSILRCMLMPATSQMRRAARQVMTAMPMVSEDILHAVHACERTPWPNKASEAALFVWRFK
jgi:hypothetical protein